MWLFSEFILHITLYMNNYGINWNDCGFFFVQGIAVKGTSGNACQILVKTAVHVWNELMAEMAMTVRVPVNLWARIVSWTSGVVIRTLVKIMGLVPPMTYHRVSTYTRRKRKTNVYLVYFSISFGNFINWIVCCRNGVHKNYILN